MAGSVLYLNIAFHDMLLCSDSDCGLYRYWGGMLVFCDISLAKNN